MYAKFASRMDNIKGSAIRALLKLADQPDIISFAGGFPAPEFFPVKEMVEVSKKVLEEDGMKALQYGPTDGLPALRQHICKLMEVQSLHAEVADILVTGGSQQGLDMAGVVLAIGIHYTAPISFAIGSVTISLSGLAVAALVGIFMNAVLPGKDYEFGANQQGDTAVNFGARQDG